jgi:transposase
VLEETNDTEELIQRVAALDIGKAELTCWVRVPGEASGPGDCSRSLPTRR